MEVCRQLTREIHLNLGWPLCHERGPQFQSSHIILMADLPTAFSLESNQQGQIVTLGQKASDLSFYTNALLVQIQDIAQIQEG